MRLKGEPARRLKEFENGGFTLKTHQMFSVHTMMEELKNAAISGHFGFLFLENSPSFSKSSVFKMFSVNTGENEKPRFSNSSGLKSVFEKLRFRDGLVWTVDETTESNFSDLVWWLR